MKRLLACLALLALLAVLTSGAARATSPLWRPGDPRPPGPLSLPKAAPGGARHIPVLALYTPERLAALGDLPALTAQLNDELAALNVSLSASGITDYDFVFSAIQPAAYHDSGTLAGDLKWLQDNWAAPQVAVAGAKLVHLFVASASDYAGLSAGLVPGIYPAVSVVWPNAQAGIYILAHEIGHNLGLSHDPEDTVGTPGWPNGHGFRMAGYRDVMCYSNGCLADFGTDCPIFAGYSDPARTRNGVPLGVPGVSEAVSVLHQTLPYVAGDTTCLAFSFALCLQNHRFQVAANWLTADGQSGSGQPIPRTADTGEFWFFSASNIEVIVKVLDGCALNGHYWVFASGLTNVATGIRVIDTQTNTDRFYNTPQGQPFRPIQDTSAFPCP